MKIGKLVEWVDYNHTYKSWEELKEYLSNNNIPFLEYNMCYPDNNRVFGKEIKISTEDIPDIKKVWEDLKLVGNPDDLDYVIFYMED